MLYILLRVICDFMLLTKVQSKFQPIFLSGRVLHNRSDHINLVRCMDVLGVRSAGNTHDHIKNGEDFQQ